MGLAVGRPGIGSRGPGNRQEGSRMNHVLHRAIALGAALAALAGCVPVAITAAGVGGSAAVSHTLNGITYKTFTIPSADVHRATLKALAKMGFKVTGTGK